jgi:ABC-type antimicrobial peptide transport system permease subunit
LIFLFGIAGGVSAGMLGGRYVESQLFGVKASDPAVFGVSVGVLLAASLAAGFVPAWRASRIDPMHALRSE